MNFFRRLKDNPALRQLAIFLSILGPGIVTGSVDNDAGGITTYSVAGAMYGYKLLWTLIPSFIALLAVQEMNARMGVVTGKGLADLIRESFGVRITFYMFIFLLIADVGNTATEFAGVAGSMNIFGVSKYISVPLAAGLVWVLVLKGNYKFAERVFLIFSVFLLSYVVSAVLAGPDWKVIGTAVITPTIQFDKEYIFTVLGIIGTTVAPWMQFYMQSAVIEKKLKVSDYKYTLWDVILGCIATIVVAFFIIVACAATLNVNGIKINEAADAAMALQPLAGALASQLFAFGLFVASIFSAAILPLATAYYVCEAFGFEAGINKKFSEAPQFYFLFTVIILIGAGIILIPGAPLIAITIWTQVINAILLPVVLVCMMVIINNKEIMEDYTNNRLQNIIGWATTAILIVLSAFLLFSGIGLG
ncbi:MAG: Nramp family divalent metal transporter [Bacteroidota bacterium]|jgi:NRAMP (natural resistance-associated macrophage protein)-like metal ion transporter